MNSKKGGGRRGVNCCHIAVKWRVFTLQLCKRFKVEAPAEYMGRGKEWNIDLIPKFFLASGESMRTVIFADLCETFCCHDCSSNE